MGELQVRRVVTGRDGADTFRSDGEPPRTVGVAGPGGRERAAVARRAARRRGRRRGPRLGGVPPRAADRRRQRPGDLPPSPARGADGGWLRVDGDDPARPGRHRTDTLDLVVVLDGAVTLGLDDGDHLLGPGDVVIQRGTEHRWRPEPPTGCTYAVVMLRPDPPRPGSVRAGHAPLEVAAAPAPTGARRPCGASSPASPAPARTGPVAFHAESVTMVDLWHTGGPLRDPAPGRHARAGRPLRARAAAGGVSARWLELRPDRATARRGVAHDGDHRRRRRPLRPARAASARLPAHRAGRRATSSSNAAPTTAGRWSVTNRPACSR